ncbi:hypothetical protein F1559_002333 [Cyanidiococcus yangmingshanensis]|uniref:DNA sliding clamp PCNA n=1 Tax=Cyanidiococcus yangmingshanensis TaxID=2690220 RepID=A0A7J7IEG9_9RHOD|nr:hypothetical protein F1559_002333 [Cyanidiococcus yangmingshanensis]
MSQMRDPIDWRGGRRAPSLAETARACREQFPAHLLVSYRRRARGSKHLPRGDYSAIMFEARFPEALLLKKILESVKDLVQDANFECTESGITLQAMDNAHVSLVTLLLRGEGFDLYRVDKPESLGINLNSMSKIMRCAANNDTVTLDKLEGADTVRFLFESPNADRMSEFHLKLMDIDSETLEIPESMYHAEIELPSAELRRIVSDLSTMGDSVRISVSKEGVRFTVRGDEGSGSVILRQSTGVDKPEEAIHIVMNEPVEQSFALKYLNLFCKAAPLSARVQIKLSKDAPLLVNFSMNNIGYLSYYLAPKIGDEDIEE